MSKIETSDGVKHEMVPCPFCMSDHIHQIYDRSQGDYYCLCRSCSAQGPIACNPVEAIKAWNERKEVKG